jgi:hypothetical protein
MQCFLFRCKTCIHWCVWGQKSRSLQCYRVICALHIRCINTAWSYYISIRLSVLHGVNWSVLWAPAYVRSANSYWTEGSVCRGPVVGVWWPSCDDSLTMKSSVFWDVTPCGSCENRRFGYYLLLTSFLAPRFFLPWWSGRYVPAIRRVLQEPHGVTPQKT